MDTLTLYFLDKFELWCESNDYSKIVLGCERINSITLDTDPERFKAICLTYFDSCWLQKL